MVLSSGTLNLKFMQRAAARNPPSTPPAQASTSIPSTPTPGPSKLAQPTSNTPALNVQETPQSQSHVGNSEQWFMPRRSPKSQPSSSSSSSRWTFEQSYMPFLGQSASIDDDEVEVKSTQPSSQSGGGRRNYGFGDEKQDEGQGADGEEEEEDEEGVDGERKLLEEIRADSAQSSTVEVRKGKRGFIRPGGFDSPLKRPKQEPKAIETPASTGSINGLVAGPSKAPDHASSSSNKAKKRKSPPNGQNSPDVTEIPAPTRSPAQSVMGKGPRTDQQKKHGRKAQTLDEREKEAKEASRRKKMENKRRKKEERLAQA